MFCGLLVTPTPELSREKFEETPNDAYIPPPPPLDQPIYIIKALQILNKPEVLKPVVIQNIKVPQRKQSNITFVSYTRFSPMDTKILMSVFLKDPKPNIITIHILADRLKVSPKKIRTWFNNRRERTKRLFNLQNSNSTVQSAQ